MNTIQIQFTKPESSSPSSTELKDDVPILSDSEKYWQHMRPFLESKGYQLRPRYQPGPPESAEEVITPLMPQWVMDATRMSDGLSVILKKIKRNSKELEITRFLSSEPLRADKRNHCVPLLDVLDPEQDDDVFIVEPLYRIFDSPEFETTEDAIVFIDQILEGLAFMHEHSVAHRDCARGNIMMDATDLYPDGFHPQERDLAPDGTHDAKMRDRTAAPQPRYYIIDFDLSTWFRDGDGNSDRLVTGKLGQDSSAPELSDDVPYDPFKVDVYTLGNVFRERLLSKHKLEVMGPLVDWMVEEDPARRPSAAEALTAFRECLEKLQSTPPQHLPDP
ncbi:hypothetical protein BOTBODRAFT_51419 [Botryobasidium botryosum FD-172 SS1]|uniref:Protein kinase domain-containing protein n=1 Tax=Botryobasidium botryosum (strain FD-172 SS1) TaxID=930990 RepID=A0A067N8F1_BOTB1|nr:hypothetical protein BOTBODRAFT_51419 [Botryobasidium botryosum FD-172 SS1]